MRVIRNFALAAGLVVSAGQSYGQDNIEQLLKNSVSDADKIVGAYITPFMKSVSLGLNQGWYNTAKPHKLLGVDLTLTTGIMVIPDDESQFNVSALGLETLELAPSSPGAPYAPTLFGDNKAPVFRVRNNSQIPEFEGAPGLGIKDEIGQNFMPVPMVHLGVGLPGNTDVKVRFVPEIDLNGNGDFNMWGVGVMHDVKQYIPGIKLLPFDLSAFAGFTRLKLRYNIEQNEVQGDNQHADIRMSATTVQALISKKLSVLTVYGGVGYNIATSTLGVRGTYDLNNDGNYDDAREVDPLKYDFSASGARATAGFRLKLAVLTLHADYTFQKYKAITAGIGINVR